MAARRMKEYRIITPDPRKLTTHINLQRTDNFRVIALMIGYNKVKVKVLKGQAGVKGKLDAIVDQFTDTTYVNY